MIDNATARPKVLLSIKRLPFYVGLLDPTNASPLPRSLPFNLYVDPKLAIPRLARSPQIENALNNAYRLGSMLSTPLGESSLATKRMNDVISSLRQRLGGTFNNKHFVEVGAGNGALMDAISAGGGVVIGFEIGPQADVARSRYGVDMIRGEISKEHVKSRVDCIYSYGCLEHIYEPDKFIETARGLLKPGGLFFHRVPNSDIIFESGEIHGLCHEHVNYFTPVNARRLFEASGFVDCNVELTKAGNEMDVWGYACPNAVLSSPGDSTDTLRAESEIIQNYQSLALANLSEKVSKIRKLVREHDSGEIAFYAGGHVLCMLAGVSGATRFFDSDEAKWGKCWLRGLSPIESPENILGPCPPKFIIVSSAHYYEEINRYLRETIGVPSFVEIVKIIDL